MWECGRSGKERASRSVTGISEVMFRCMDSCYSKYGPGPRSLFEMKNLIPTPDLPN